MKKMPTIVAIAAVILLAFTFIWVWLAAQGTVPVIQAPLENVSPVVRIIVLLVLTAIIWVIFTRTQQSAE